MHTQPQENSVDTPLTTTFELNDTLWAEATMDESDEIYLWLGVRN
jgi:hypothetical protein